jgi:hypothetical protein
VRTHAVFQSRVKTGCKMTRYDKNSLPGHGGMPPRQVGAEPPAVLVLTLGGTVRSWLPPATPALHHHYPLSSVSTRRRLLAETPRCQDARFAGLHAQDPLCPVQLALWSRGRTKTNQSSNQYAQSCQPSQATKQTTDAHGASKQAVVWPRLPASRRALTVLS